MNLTTAFPYRIAAFALFLLAYPLSFLLPDWTSWENGPIEMLDNLVLVIGALQAVVLAVRSQSPWRWLWVAIVPIWIVCAGREITWGAVFYPPIGMTEDGPVFSSKELWYAGAVKPVLAALVLFSLAFLVRFKLWRLLTPIFKARQFPTLEIVMTGICLLLMTAAERHMGMSLDAYVGISQVVEETVELAGYLFLLTAQQRIRIAAEMSWGTGEKRT